MSDFLNDMARMSAERAARAGKFAASDFDRPPVLPTLDAFDVIAEIKDRSPAEGVLASAERTRSEKAREYAEGGAAIISVLTEPSRFAGDLAHVGEVVAAVPDTPVMRKDFLVDPVQILEARAAGASGVLLIVTMLSDSALRSMLDCANEHGMFVLLESFDAEDLDRLPRLLLPGDADRALENRLLFGVNSRNLRTLEVDADRFRKLAKQLPAGKRVAESGLQVAEDAAQVATWGYSLGLVGTALMRSRDSAVLIAGMKAAGRMALAA